MLRVEPLELVIKIGFLARNRQALAVGGDQPDAAGGNVDLGDLPAQALETLDGAIDVGLRDTGR